MSNYMLRAREPISSFTHFIGALIAGGATILLVSKVLLSSDFSNARMISCLLFGLSLIALYTSSAVYHFSNGNAHRQLLLRKLDHSMIFVLIAGSYTPILLNYLPDGRGGWFTAFIWAFAAAGILMKLCWFNAPRWLQTTLYIAMGWAIVIDPSVFSIMATGALVLLVLGGLSYTFGGIIYMIKKPNISTKFGFHELFHIFVMLGSTFHFMLVFLYIA